MLQGSSRTASLHFTAQLCFDIFPVGSLTVGHRVDCSLGAVGHRVNGTCNLAGCILDGVQGASIGRCMADKQTNKQAGKQAHVLFMVLEAVTALTVSAGS